MTAGPGSVLRSGRIGGLTLPHRIVMGAMHLGWETRDDGGVALAAFYTERVRGGAGLMVTGGVAVNAEGSGGPAYGLLTDARHRERLARVAGEVGSAGGLIALQLFHAGRYAPTDPVGPSAVYSRFSRATPAALDAAGIDRTIADFARGAARARELDFAAVEIMGSEGYLIDQFLSPLTNHREDEWVGAAFAVAVVRAVRDAVGEGFPVIMRMTGDDLMPGGTRAAAVAAYARELVGAGADALNVGVGWHESPVPTVQALVPPGHWVPVAEAVKAAAGAIPVLAGNRINRLSQAAAVLTGTAVDFVSMARPFLADPALVASGRRGRPVNVCVACNQACIDRSLSDQAVSCMVNPRAGREHEPVVVAARAGSVAVLGAGPAGLAAARELVRCGHRVTVMEAGGEPGGQFRLAALVPGKADYREAIWFHVAELTRLGGVLHAGRAVTAADRDLLASFDGVIVATGVRPRPITLPGGGLPHVRDYASAFTAPLGERVVIIGGGGIAADLAHTIDGPAVTVLYRGPKLAPRIGRSTRWTVLAELRRRGVRTVPGVRDLRIDRNAVHGSDAAGGPLTVPADSVVIAAGQLPEDALVETVRSTGVWHRIVGGARDTGGLDAVRAFAEGRRAATEFHAAHGRLDVDACR